MVYLADRAPSQVGTELSLAGYRGVGGTGGSEVLYLCEHENVDLVVIGAEVEDADMIQLQCGG